MSTDHIEFNGDDLARRVPLLAQAKKRFETVGDAMVEIAACRWAEGAPDDDTTTLQARDAVHRMIADYFFPGFYQSGEVFGFQGEKLGVYKHIGDNTEGTTTEAASSWTSGRH